VLVNGDSHFLQIDKPLTDAAGNTIDNVTRVQTFGSDQNHWVSASVNPRDPTVFTFHQHIVAANVPTYVAP
jgi:tRNA A37 threonylcarbamoyltransferase TsaD